MILLTNIAYTYLAIQPRFGNSLSKQKYATFGN